MIFSCSRYRLVLCSQAATSAVIPLFPDQQFDLLFSLRFRLAAYVSCADIIVVAVVVVIVVAAAVLAVVI